MHCDDCGHYDSRLVGGLCPACRRHPRNKGDGLEPLDGQPRPEDTPMSFETQIREILEPAVHAGALHAEDLDAERRRKAVALHMDAQHRDGVLQLDWMLDGSQTIREQPGTGEQRSLQLIAQVSSALYNNNDSAAQACVEEVLARAERHHFPWLDEQISIIRADTHEPKPDVEKRICQACGGWELGPMPGGVCRRCREEIKREAG